MGQDSERGDAPPDSADGEGADATDITLTAAQVQHGHVRWAPLGTRISSAAGAGPTAPGQLVPNEDRTARLGAPAQGRVVAVRVAPGDRVQAGRVLVTLQSPEAGAAQADLTKARAEVASGRAQATYASSARQRAERLLALKAIPRQDYERAVADDELARSTLTQAEAELRRAETTARSLGATASPSGDITLRAPLTGVVLARTAVPGAVVEAGSPLVVVTDPATLWVTVDAPETLSGSFRVGGTLRFTVPAYPADTFTARIQAVGAGLDPERRTLPVRGVVANRDGRLKPEMLATVAVAGPGGVSGPASSVFLPADAVQRVGGRSVVFVVMPDGKGGGHFMGRAVEIGARSGNQVAVTHGLQAGDLVVTDGAFAVKAQLEKGAMPDMEM
jgi:cobalt-zinc-cadmium efflux system membrane fusion protein